MHALEEIMPMWLLECLLVNKIPPVPVTKISFVLLPYPNKDPDGEQLPELLNTYAIFMWSAYSLDLFIYIFTELNPS